MIRALVVGINVYKNFPDQSLAGCANDARDVVNYLVDQRGVAADAISVLGDGDATKDAIVAAFRDMIAQGRSGDHLLFQFSGHGAQVPTNSVSEPDGLDEVLCPHDFTFDDTSTALSDKELSALIATVPSGVLLTIVVDACHSGDVTDERELGKQKQRPRYLVPPWKVQARLKGRSLIASRALAANCATVSACKSSETAADTQFDGRPNGAFTHAWLDALKGKPDATLDELIAAVTPVVAAFGMHPEVDGPLVLRTNRFLVELARTVRELVAPVSARFSKRVLTSASRSVVLLERGWHTNLLGLPIGIELQLTQAETGFSLDIAPTVAGAKENFSVALDGDASIPIPLSVIGQLVVEISNWNLSGGQLSFDLAARVLPSLPFVPAVPIMREHVALTLPGGTRALVVPQTPSEFAALLQLLRESSSPARPISRDVTGSDSTPFVAKMERFGWGPNWSEDRTIWVGSLPHNQLRSSVVLTDQQGAGTVGFIDWVNDDPTDASFRVHIGNNFFGGWGSIAYQVMAVYGNVDINIQPRRLARSPIGVPVHGQARHSDGQGNHSHSPASAHNGASVTNGGGVAAP